jgi:hypothetical protein
MALPTQRFQVSVVVTLTMAEPRLGTRLVQRVVLVVPETEIRQDLELAQQSQAQSSLTVAVARLGTHRLGQMLPQRPTEGSVVMVATRHLPCEVMTVVQEL